MDSVFLSVDEYAASRDALLSRIVARLEGDVRVQGAWLSGSFGRGEADAWADFDLHVAVADDEFPTFWDERLELYDKVGRVVLVQADMPSDSLPGGRFQLVLFAGALEVDWNVGPLSKAVRPLAHQMLFARVDVPVVEPKALSADERRQYAQRVLTFFWAKAPIATKYAARADTRRAVMQIELLSQAFISLSRLAAEEAGPDPRLHAMNRILEDDIDARLPRVASTVDALGALDVIRRLCDEVEALHVGLSAIGVAAPRAMPDEMRALIALAASAAATGPQSRRKYR